ncbi:hypothetical protein CspHIS471_0306920 [Cutaneotrichosporon sp. HIS471]|nr:hypothetical protein CspHIS471_0306920 [Cutaneotrichosporon sp. HIS471]
MDAKSLLRAKKAGSRIQHPYASYSAAGQLRCSICAVPVKQWDAHLLTKAHRQSVAREKKEAAAVQKKRAAEDEAESSSKRAKISNTEDGEEEGRSKLPAGFFSAGNQPQPQEDEGEEEEEKEKEKQPEADAELDAFLASLNDGPGSAGTTAAPAPVRAPAQRKRRTYKEPEEDGVTSYSAAPQLVKDKNEEEREATPESEETEAERRARLAREEREEVLARLEEEQRAQEDADARVDALKARMEALKKRREARGAGGGGKGVVAKALTKAASKNK